MEHKPRIELLNKWGKATKDAELALREMITDELRQAIPEAEAKEAEAARRLRECLDALEPGEKALAALEADISRCEGESGQIRLRTESGDLIERVRARQLFKEFDAELSALTEKRAQLETDLAPLRGERQKLRVELEIASLERAGLESNADPRWAFIGAGAETTSYGLFRFGWALTNILRDEDNVEYQAARAFMDYLCKVSGYRTDHLPREAEQIKRSFDEYLAEHSKPATGLEDAATVVRAYELEAATRLTPPVPWPEDLRGVTTPGNAARNQRVPEYLATPDLPPAARRR